MILSIKIKSFCTQLLIKTSFSLIVICLSITPSLAANILILGDSLSASYGINENKGWVRLLQQQLPQHQIINGSVNGETSGGGLRRLPALLDSSLPDLVVVELGGNDGLRGFPPSKLKQNLTEIIQIAKHFGSDVLLTEIMVPPNYGPRYSKSFNQVYQQLANELNVELVPFFMTEIAPNPQLMQSDGIHPNEKAQPQITSWMRPWIESALLN